MTKADKDEMYTLVAILANIGEPAVAKGISMLPKKGEFVENPALVSRMRRLLITYSIQHDPHQFKDL